MQVTAYLKARPPKAPVVILMGTSAARESISSEAGWTAQIRSLGGRAVRAYDLGSSNQSFAQDLAVMEHLPKLRGIVYIGVDVVRFAQPPARVQVRLPAPARSLVPYDPHRYSAASILPAAMKRNLVTRWLHDRYPVFTTNYTANLTLLRRLVIAVEAHGLHPVLLDMPLNSAVAGRRWASALHRYRSASRLVATAAGIPFVQLQPRLSLPSRDFYDDLHLVQPGRVIWQTALSQETVRLLRRYALR